jgi:hypothetical protein
MERMKSGSNSLQPPLNTKRGGKKHKLRLLSSVPPLKLRGCEGALCFALILLSSVAILSLPKDALAFKLPDSDQRKCYQAIRPYAEIPCAGTGQDGAYIINPLSYTNNGNGTVKDNNTGLMWQRCSVGQNNDSTCSGGASTYNWYQATGEVDSTYNPSGSRYENVCGSLNLGGYSDWRLPSKKELITIVDYAISYPGTTINTTYFPNTIASSYWSSTNADYAWSVSFGVGDVDYWSECNFMHVRCVRGGK